MRWGQISGSECSLFPHVEGLSPKIHVDSVVRSPGDEHHGIIHGTMNPWNHEPMKPIQYPPLHPTQLPPPPHPLCTHDSNNTPRPQLKSTCLTVPSSPRCTFNLPSPHNQIISILIPSNQINSHPCHPTHPLFRPYVYANKTYLSGFQSPATTPPGSTIRCPFGKSRLANDYFALQHTSAPPFLLRAR